MDEYGPTHTHTHTHTHIHTYTHTHKSRVSQLNFWDLISEFRSRLAQFPQIGIDLQSLNNRDPNRTCVL